MIKVFDSLIDRCKSRLISGPWQSKVCTHHCKRQQGSTKWKCWTCVISASAWIQEDENLSVAIRYFMSRVLLFVGVTLRCCCCEKKTNFLYCGHGSEQSGASSDLFPHKLILWGNRPFREGFSTDRIFQSTAKHSLKVCCQLWRVIQLFIATNASNCSPVMMLHNLLRHMLFVM